MKNPSVGFGLFFGLIVSLPAQVALVQHAPSINGTVEGSVRQMLAENTVLNGGAVIAGDLLVPGTPTVNLNGNPFYGGTVDGSGAAAPGNYKITLNGSAVLHNVVRRTDPTSLPSVGAPATPTGSASLVINSSGQPIDWATVRNVTVSGGAGAYIVPAGAYGDFAVSGSSSLTLGVAGATTPATYSFQHLTLNGGAHIEVAGPVTITVANGMSPAGNLGNTTHPEWLTLRFFTGGLTLTGNVAVYGYVVAPNGPATFGGDAQLVGGLVADELSVSGNAVLRLLAVPTANQPPVVALTAPANGAIFAAPASFNLTATASDTDGSVAKVEFFEGNLKLGEDPTAPYTLAHSVSSPGSHTYVARATDSQGAATDSAPVTIVVTGPNQPPVVTLTAPADGTLLTAPANLTLMATASDPDGSISKVEFYDGATKLGEDLTAPYAWSLSNLAAGTYNFSARAYDQPGLSTTSAIAALTVVASNQSPTVALTAPADGTTFTAPAAFTVTATAVDSDGLITKVEFFANSTKVGEDTVAPYEFAISGLAAGTYNFVARATDNSNSATDSAPATVYVTSNNQPPTVALTASAAGASFPALANIVLAATAADNDGTVAKVEFYQGAAKLGESLAAPYTFTWTAVAAGTYSLTARAIDNGGASTLSAAQTITVGAADGSLPFIAEFEPAQGYQLGALAGQLGWTATPGVTVVASAVAGSLQEVAIAGGATPAQLAHAISGVGASPVFVDFFARPVAGATPADAVVFNSTATRIALVGAASPARLQVFDGNTWLATPQTVAVDGAGRAVAWLRLTTREDYVTKKWDLYADGRMIMADVPFIDLTATSLATFSLTGHATAAASFDDFYAGPDNPIAADADHDGMDDAWETAHGLNPNLNDRNGDADGDGLTNIQEYVLGTNPNAADSDGDGIPDKEEVLAGTNPLVNDAGGDVDHDGVSNLIEYRQGRSLTKGATPDVSGQLEFKIYLPR